MISERKKVAFEFVSDASKQVTTVAAALVGLSITFRQELMKGTTDVPLILQATVVAYVLSVFAGVVVLLTLAGALGHEPEAAADNAPKQVGTVPKAKGAAQGAREAAPRRGPEPISDEHLTIYRPSIRLPFGIQLGLFFVAVLGTFFFGWTHWGVPSRTPPSPSYAFARASLLSGVRCVLTEASDAAAAKCARVSTDLAFRYRPPPAEAASYITAISVAAARIDSATSAAATARKASGARAKGPVVSAAPVRPRLIDAYMSLDSILSLARFDSASAAP